MTGRVAAHGQRCAPPPTDAENLRILPLVVAAPLLPLLLTKSHVALNVSPPHAFCAAPRTWLQLAEAEGFLWACSEGASPICRGEAVVIGARSSTRLRGWWSVEPAAARHVDMGVGCLTVLLPAKLEEITRAD